MDIFSLEEDGGDELFLTQTPKDNYGEDMQIVQDGEKEEFLGVPIGNFAAPCGSIVNQACGQATEYE